MKRILDLIFILLTMSVMIFSEEMPKEVRTPSDKLSLSKNNEVLYEGVPYTGKLFNDISYMNLKDGHLDGETYSDDGNFKNYMNIVNGEFEGEYIRQEIIYGENVDVFIIFNNGEIKTYKVSVEKVSFNLEFDSNGNANGVVIDQSTNEKTYLKEGIGKLKDGYVKIFLGNEKDEVIYSKLDKNGKLIRESGRGYHRRREYLERMWFAQFFGKEPNELIKLLEKIKKTKKEIENEK